MPVQNCPIHNLPQLVLCCQGECLGRYCSECFLTHNLQHTNGVIINQVSKNSLIEWNKFLLDKFQQILKTIKNKGINIIYQMRLNPNYPKGLINELSNSQLVDCAIKIFQQYVQTLLTNIQFISACQNIQQLDIPEFYKDLFIFFVYDAASGLYFLQEKTINSVKAIYTTKKIYDFVELALTPKEQRNLEQKRKSIVSVVEKQSLIRIKKEVVNSPNRSKLYQLQKQKDSPKRNTLLSQKRMKSYNENNNFNYQSNSPLQETQSILNTKQTIRSTQNSVSQDRYKKISESESQKIELKEQIIDPNLQPMVQQVREVKNIEKQLPPQKQLFISAQKEEKIEQKQEQVIQQAKEQLKYQKIEEPVEENKEVENKEVENKEVENKEVEENKEERIVEQNKSELVVEQKEKEEVSQLQNIKLKLKQKQNSIRELNNVISNQQEQIQCRQNQVEDLNEQIKKLRDYKQKCQYLQQQLNKIRKQLEFKQRSIAQLNKLIGNEEQQIQFRQNQVQTLTIEIKKLVEWRQKCQQIQAKLNFKEKELDERERGIKQLNNVIGNQEEQLAFRENQVQMLTSELKKSNEARASADKIIQQQSKDLEDLKRQKEQLEISLKKAEQNLEKQKQKQIREQEDHENYDHQLLQQTIELESQVCARNSDIKELVQILNKIQNQIPASKRSEIIQALKKLKTVQLSF